MSTPRVEISSDALTEARSLYEDYHWTIGKLSTRYGVSAPTMKLRLLETGACIRSKIESAKLTIGSERSEALRLGASRYFTGKPCARGHVAERQTANRCCVECQIENSAKQYSIDPERFREKSRSWYGANREKSKESSLRWRTNNPGKADEASRRWEKNNWQRVLDRNTKWRSANPDKAKAAVSRWLRENPERVRALKSKRRAMKLGAQGAHGAEDVYRMIKFQRNKCAHAWCRVSLKLGYHIDHKIPLFLGGTNWPENLQLLCPKCNLSKGKRHPIEHAQRHGFLL